MATMSKVTLCVLLLACGVFGAAWADEADGIVGQWLSEKSDARFEIYKDGGKYCGKIIWLQEPVYPPDDSEAGLPKHDRKNPDPAMRNQPILGLQLLKDFEYKGDNAWAGGTIYNPENGKLYNAKLRLDGKDTPKVRGYIGISLIGETTVWTRYAQPAEAPAEKKTEPGK
jgi:uncharacterized protein (DUF2147 family)